MRRARVDALLPFPAIMAENERLTVPHRHATDPERRPRPRPGPSRCRSTPRALRQDIAARTLGSLARGRPFCSSCWRLGDSATGSETVDHTTGALGRCASRDPGWRRASPFPSVPTRRWPTGRSSARIWLTRALSCSAPERIRTSDLRFRRPTLYPAELRAQGRLAARFESSGRASDRPRGRRGRDSNPRWGLIPILA